MNILRIDEKWSIKFDPQNNCRPLEWLRYGEFHSKWDEGNATLALFYAFLEKTDNERSKNRA